jgi:ABC-type polysaccharide/polyol phosphate export permease
VAILPYFFAGSLFPISALPAGLEVIAKALPLTHVLALLRYGIVDTRGASLHDIWGMDNTTAMAALSLGVVATFAVAMTIVAIRVFRRAAVGLKTTDRTTTQHAVVPGLILRRPRPRRRASHGREPRR